MQVKKYVIRDCICYRRYSFIFPFARDDFPLLFSLTAVQRNNHELRVIRPVIENNVSCKHYTQILVGRFAAIARHRIDSDTNTVTYMRTIMPLLR